MLVVYSLDKHKVFFGSQKTEKSTENIGGLFCLRIIAPLLILWISPRFVQVEKWDTLFLCVKLGFRLQTV